MTDVREKIKWDYVHKATCGYISVDEATDGILAIPELLEKDPDQSLPDNPYSFEEPTLAIVQMIDGWMHKGYEKAQQDMLKENWVKVKEK